ncbi:hypothetical protein VTO42DRAFT_4122 [Malbranchea cinnamomea]
MSDSELAGPERARSPVPTPTPNATTAGESPPRLRAAAACVACNKKKIRCVFPDGGSQCSNCARNHWACTPRERKRKRRKISTADGPGISPSTGPTGVHQQDNKPPPLLAPHRPSWESSGFGAWDPARPILADPSPAGVLSDSSTAGVTTNGYNQTPAATAIPDQDGSSSQFAHAGSSSLPSAQRPEAHHPYANSSDNCTFLGRSEYIHPMDEDRAKSYPPAVASERLTDEDIRMLEMQRCFELPPRAVREGLIDTFMKHCAPWMPIVERSWLTERSGHQPSILLLQAVFLAASRVSSAPAVAAYASSNEFYRRAKALFWSGYEKNTITVITAVCILHWYNPEGPEHFSINTSGFWSRIGVGLAYQIGLHKEPPPGREAALRRRLWWTIFARDALINAGHGRPRGINLKDCEVRPLCIEDFYGSSANGALFIAYVELSSILGELTQCCLRKNLTRQKRTALENALYRWSRELPEQLRLFRKIMTSDNPSKSKLVLAPYNFEARQLHVPYFVIIAILYRSSGPNNGPSSAALLASSFVAGIFEDFLARDQIRCLGAIFTFYLLAAGVGLTHCYTQPHLWDRAEQDLRIVYNSLRELSKRWPSGTGSLKALQGMMEEISKLPRQTERPQQPNLLTLEEQTYFSGFGMDLCRLGDVILSPYNHDFPDSSRRTDDDQCVRTVSDMMTAGILAELKAPMDGPAGLDEYLPLAPLVDPQPATTQSASSGDGVEMTDDFLCGQYEGIGNWLLRDWDWNSDLNW